MKDIVLVHGALGAAAQFDALVPLLANRYKVHVYEITGHGKRSVEEPIFTMLNFVNDFKKYLQQFSDPVTVFGFSMGGYISLSLAKSNPGYFQQIITLGTKFHWTVEESLKETAKLNAELLEIKVPQYCDYLKSLHGDNWKNVVDKTKQVMLGLGQELLLTVDTVKNISVKTTVMLGELDKMVTREESEKMSAAIPGAAFKLLPGFVHPLEKLDPVELASVLKTV